MPLPTINSGSLFTPIVRSAKRPLKWILLFIGIVGTIMILLAFTRIPFDAHRALASIDRICTDQVDRIVILGGSGMPSGPELLRLHHGALEAARSPEASVYVVHPKDTAVMQEMVNELILKRVEPERIVRILEGTNTRGQAIALAAAIEGKDERIAIVTAPENMYRTLAAFRSVGFTRSCAAPAFDHAMFVNLDYDHRRIGGNKAVPDVSGSLDLRYNFWNYLKLEITCLREYVAIAYYKLNGWI